MIHVVRLQEPEILTRKKDTWKNNFISSGKDRPSTTQYGHHTVRECLNTMSNHKCYYCEQTLKDTINEIDHFIEVAERKDLAFEWTNLYLACDNCNSKHSNTSIPVTDVLDPCVASNQEIERAIYFETEQIKAVPGSDIGLLSIKKYKLHTDLLDRLRSKRLNAFYEEYVEIKEQQTREGRTSYSNAEMHKILRYANADQPFSLMFRLLLRKKGFTV
jgi:hypothetical protein